MQKFEFNSNMRMLLLLFLLCVSMAIQAQAQEESKDLEDYLGASIEEVTADFPDLSEPGLNTWGYVTHSDWLFIVSYWIAENQHEVREITLNQAHEGWTICGLYPGQSAEEQEQILEGENYQKIRKNFSEKWNLYYNGENRIISISSEGAVSLCEIQFGSHTDKQELFTCLGMTMEEVSQMISGLTMRTEDEKVILEKEGISFEGTCEAGMTEEETPVKSITISETDGDYCLYGLMPGDERENARYLCFGLGGSGEFIDPGNAVLFVGNYGLIQSISLTYDI